LIKKTLKNICLSPKKHLKLFLGRIFFYSKIESLTKKFKIKQITKDKIEIIYYFSEDIEELDNLDKLIYNLTILAEEYSLLILTREQKASKLFKKRLFKVLFVKRLNDLLGIYNIVNPKIIIYTGNNYKNFQSLIYNNAIHLYLNNSLKTIISNNQIKGYDFILIENKKEMDKIIKNIIRIKRDRFILIDNDRQKLITAIARLMEFRDLEIENKGA